ncbi:MAG: EAL domain-containing protein [Gammaproteobacteria bacterium]
MKSLGTRLALVISSVLLCLMFAANLWLERQLTEAIYEEERAQAESHAKTLLASLQTLMLNGQGTLAREWLDRMHGIAGIVDIEVLRRNGQEAFSDLATVKLVNQYLNIPRFQREANPPHDPSPPPMDIFQRALKGEFVVDRKADSMTVMMPIPVKTECLACHGYEDAPLRGILKLTLSSEAAEARLQSMRNNLWMISTLMVALIGIVMWTALRLSVLRPISALRDAIVRVGQGERNTKLPVLHKDELGEVATVFNRMQNDLQAYEARIRAVTDNVLDAIITIDERGIIESVNLAVEKIFGYAPHELLGQNVSRLMPEPYRSMHDEYLGNYLRTGNARIIGGRRELVGMRKDGFIFPIDIAVSEMRVAGSRRFIGIVRDITERKEQMAALEYQALHDALTSLPNRTLLSDRLYQAILRAQREGVQLALVLTDLDRFKEINDTLGHQNGDLILQQVAQRLRNALRESDTIARLGGDEFAILLPTADLALSTQIVRKLAAVLEEPFMIEEQSLHVAASFGIALYPDHGADEDALMRHADVAMYIAKRANLGYAIYDPAKDQHSLRNLALMGDLRAAIDNGDLILFYQPKVNLATGKVVGVEALVRWRHPRHGLMFPDSFIPLAEQIGLINPLTYWVVGEALRQCRIWNEKGIMLSVAVNLSARNLLDIQLPFHIDALFSGACKQANRLVLEITETAVMADTARALAALASLREMGVKLSIDDFGTGYSSLSYLKQLPVHELKIDKSFVLGMAVDDNDAVIVRSTIDLAHNIGLAVVAEGVEDKATYDLLTRLGCDVAQGYYISRPIPAEELERWLVESCWGLES